MKTTIDLPDPLFRRAKATAAEKGVSLKSFITAAVEQSLAPPTRPWSTLVSVLPEVAAETLAVVEQRIAEADAADLAQPDTSR